MTSSLPSSLPAARSRESRVPQSGEYRAGEILDEYLETVGGLGLGAELSGTQIANIDRRISAPWNGAPWCHLRAMAPVTASRHAWHRHARRNGFPARSDAARAQAGRRGRRCGLPMRSAMTVCAILPMQCALRRSRGGRARGAGGHGRSRICSARRLQGPDAGHRGAAAFRAIGRACHPGLARWSAHRGEMAQRRPAFPQRMPDVAIVYAYAGLDATGSASAWRSDAGRGDRRSGRGQHARWRPAGIARSLPKGWRCARAARTKGWSTGKTRTCQSLRRGAGAIASTHPCNC